MSDEIIINKVAESGLITINLEDFYPKEPVVVFDLAAYLFRGLILKEKEFREAMKQIDWMQYQDKIVLIQNAADAIIPMWAYMLVTSYLQPFAKEISYGTERDFYKNRLMQNIDNLDAGAYAEKRIVIKGCGDIEMPETAYIMITQKLRPVVKSLMFGEACSTVPVYKMPLTKKL